MSNEILRVGMLGAGTVGGGVVAVLRRNRDEIFRRLGRYMQVTHIAFRDREKHRSMSLDGIKCTLDPRSIVHDPDVDIVVEVMGGIIPAKNLVLEALENGKSVVTANKALLAEHGNEIFSTADKNGVFVAYEAAVAGGIPIIKALREGMSGNSILSLYGIINGTTNYILSLIGSRRCSFGHALKDAQEQGYAEADPAFDIDGVDAAHKLTILASAAFGIPLNFDKVYVEGIRHLDVQDVMYSDELGYTIKHLGIARRNGDGIELRVHPALIPQSSIMAHVDMAMNAVMVRGDAVGASLYYGLGAGAEATASAIIADLLDLARCRGRDPLHAVPHLAFHPRSIRNEEIFPMDKVVSAYYLRLQVLDKSGALAAISTIFASLDISLQTVLQKEVSSGERPVPLVLFTYPAEASKVHLAVKEIEQLECVTQKIVKICVEKFL